MILKAVQIGKLKGFNVGGKLKGFNVGVDEVEISHLQFADDTVVVGEAIRRKRLKIRKETGKSKVGK